MIALHPLPEVDFHCPHDDAPLEAVDWCIQGKRNLAFMRCPTCQREYYGDLPAGHGLLNPTLLETATGQVYADKIKTGAWFAQALATTYANRHRRPFLLTDETFRDIRKPLLVNCVDDIYGHALEKLLNVQFYLDQHPDDDLILLIPRFLRWMVPDGVAAVWTLDTSLRENASWNMALNDELHHRLAALGECRFAPTVSELEPTDYQIQRFTGVTPFNVDTWHHALARPTVTFIWREDRLWDTYHPRNRTVRAWKKLRLPDLTSYRRSRQTQRVLKLAEGIRRELPALDFAVAGIGQASGLPAWIDDLRTTQVDPETEIHWCERYSRSHLVIGVHGSNMLLPSAHAGSVIDLMPVKRWRNLVQDIIYTPEQTGRELMFRYRYLSVRETPAQVAGVAVEMLSWMPYILLRYRRPWNDLQAVNADPYRWRRQETDVTQARRKYFDD